MDHFFNCPTCGCQTKQELGRTEETQPAGFGSITHKPVTMKEVAAINRSYPADVPEGFERFYERDGDNVTVGVRPAKPKDAKQEADQGELGKLTALSLADLQTMAAEYGVSYTARTGVARLAADILKAKSEQVPA